MQALETILGALLFVSRLIFRIAVWIAILLGICLHAAMGNPRD